MPKTLKNWWVKRSGNGMTVFGTCCATGEQTKITDVTLISEGETPSTIAASTRAGVDHTLRR